MIFMCNAFDGEEFHFTWGSPPRRLTYKEVDDYISKGQRRSQ
jgi:hypothetical protein